MSRKSIYDNLNIIRLVELTEGYRLNDFCCKSEPYNEFLHNEALSLQEYEVSKVHLLINKTNADVIAYMSLSADIIRLTTDEKGTYDMDSVSFSSIPAVKIGHLAVDENYKEIYKEIGSLMVELARGICIEMRTHGVACRFITVDADVENDPDICDFYIKNGFKFNESREYHKRKNPSLRLDIDGDIEEVKLQELG